MFVNYFKIRTAVCPNVYCTEIRSALDMTTISYDTLFEHTQGRLPDYVEVSMDGARIVAVAEGQAGAVATRRLGVCSRLCFRTDWFVHTRRGEYRSSNE